MHLIAGLLAGVRGAENGKAHVTVRGTGALATLYADFDNTPLTNPSAGIDLDGYGGATVYVNESVDVVASDANGQTIREWTEMAAAPDVEVRSLSFTGTHYTDGSHAAGYPTTLQAVLDGVEDSFGATDWNVALPDGTTVTVKAALAGTAGIFINVKDGRYGAVGDGLTDDTAAIQLAINAASGALGTGGIVVFPAGAYKTSAALQLPANVSLWGVSRQTCQILLNHATANAIEMTATASSGYQEIRNLNIAPLIANSGNVLKYVNGGARTVAVINSSLGSALNNSSAATIHMPVTGLQRLLVDASTIAGAQTQGAIIDAQSFTVRVEMRNSLISGLAGTTGGLAFLVAAYNLKAVSTTFSIVSTAGTSFAIGFSSSGASGPNISVIGCDFATGYATYAWFCISTFDAAATQIVEQGNTYSATFLSPFFGITSGGVNAPTIRLGFRDDKQKAYASDATPLALDAASYSVVSITRSTNASQTLTVTTQPRRSRLFVIYFNASAGVIAAITFSTGFNLGLGTVPAISLNAGQAFVQEFVSVDVGGGLGCFWQPVGASLKA